MAEYYVDPEWGNDSNNGTSTSTPWKLIPGQTGANSVSAGDIINVKNGTVSSAGRLIFPANNLTYRGYGLAQPLYLTIPTDIVGGKRQHKAVREEGVHEGFWTLYEPTQTSSIVAFSSRTGCTIEDVCVIAPLSVLGISIGTSTGSITSCTVRRSMVLQCTAGIEAYGRGLILEDIYIKDIANDGIVIAASAANSYRTGYTDKLNRICIINPGYDEATGIGDAFQTTASSARFESRLVIENLYVNKTSSTKQALVFTDILGGLLLNKFYIESTESGQAQVLISGIGGQFTISNGYIENGCTNNAAFRYAGTQGIETGTSLTIKNVEVHAPVNAGFFTWGGSEDASTVDGTVFIDNCAMNGENQQDLSYSATVSFHAGANITIGSNAKGYVRNCVFSTSGKPTVRLPTGDANSAKWNIQNIGTSNPSFAIGSTAYSTVAAFEAAHSYAVNNKTLVNTGLINNTETKQNGKFVAYTADGAKSSYYNPPSLGPFEYVTPRGIITNRGIR